MNKSQEHWAKSGWAISLGTAIFSFLLTMGYDYSKQIPAFTTANFGIKWISNIVWNLLNFNIKVWWIIVTIMVIAIIIYIIYKFSNNNNDSDIESFKPDFYNYKEDNLKIWRWSWEWKFNIKQNNWNISDLKAHCPNCNTPMIETNDRYFGLGFSCPRCNFKSEDLNLKNRIK